VPYRRYVSRVLPGRMLSSRVASPRVLGAGLAAAAVALAAGCTAAAPGATYNSPAVGPVRTSAFPKSFSPFPEPAVWNGLDNAVYQMVVKAKTGTTARNFRFIARTEMVLWLNCIGKGKAQLASPALGLKWEIRCGNGGSPGGINVKPGDSLVGHGVDLRVTVTKGSRWEVRIDGIAAHGVNPPPALIPGTSTPA
jgi:hypothetical protein